MSKVCCHCLKENPEVQANCSYHSRCKKCEGKTIDDCILCKACNFKALKFECANCNKSKCLLNLNPFKCLHMMCDKCNNTSNNTIHCKKCSTKTKNLSTKPIGLVSFYNHISQLCTCSSHPSISITKFQHERPDYKKKVFIYKCRHCSRYIPHHKLVYKQYDVILKIKEVIAKKEYDDYYITNF